MTRGWTAPQSFLVNCMLFEFLGVAALVGAIMLVLGFFGGEKRPYLLAAGGIVLVVAGLFAAMDTTGIEVQTYGGCMNASYENSYVWNDTCYLQTDNETDMTYVPCIRDQYNITYTYGPCYHHSLGFNFTQGIALMLILVGIGTLLGTVQWMRQK